MQRDERSAVARQRRQGSDTGLYHVTSRGAGRRNLFEDDGDRSLYLSKLRRFSSENDVSIHAWCLMNNHVHLLLACDLADLTALMRALNTAYAQHFNGRHGHVGPVFQGRFASIPIEDESHLLETVRCIHLNPQAAGIDAAESFPWSSYQEYVPSPDAGCAPLCDTSLVLGMLDDFVGFHQVKGMEIEVLDLTPVRPYRSDAEVAAVARKLFGEAYADAIASMPKADRNASLVRLHAQGASIRQLERLTGIGRGVIQTAVKEGNAAKRSNGS